MPRARVSARDQTLTIGAQLAAIESEIGTIAGLVMQAAMIHNPNYVVTAGEHVDMLDDMVTALGVDVRRLRLTMTGGHGPQPSLPDPGQSERGR